MEKYYFRNDYPKTPDAYTDSFAHKSLLYYNNNSPTSADYNLESDGIRTPHRVKVKSKPKRWAIIGLLCSIAMLIAAIGFIIVTIKTSAGKEPQKKELAEDFQGYNNLIVFGASYCDNGQQSYLHPDLVVSPPDNYFHNRWTNGPVWNDLLTASIGVNPEIPANLLNYAFAGATVDNQLSATQAPDFVTQLSLFLNDAETEEARTSNQKSLISVWIGINMISRIFQSTVNIHGTTDRSGARARDAIKQIDENVKQLFEQLKRLDTRAAFHHAPPDYLLMTVPSIDLLPQSIKFAESTRVPAAALDYARYLSTYYNKAIEDSTKQWSNTVLESSRVFFADIAAWWNEMVKRPGLYGLQVVNHGCLRDNCEDPKYYLYWDSLHPTTAVHQKIADQISAVLMLTQKTRAKEEKSA